MGMSYITREKNQTSIIELLDNIEIPDKQNNEKEDLRINNNVLLSDYIQESDFVFFLAFDVGGSRYLSKYQHSFDFQQQHQFENLATPC